MKMYLHHIKGPLKLWGPFCFEVLLTHFSLCDTLTLGMQTSNNYVKRLRAPPHRLKDKKYLCVNFRSFFSESGKIHTENFYKTWPVMWFCLCINLFRQAQMQLCGRNTRCKLPCNQSTMV